MRTYLKFDVSKSIEGSIATVVLYLSEIIKRHFVIRECIDKTRRHAYVRSLEEVQEVHLLKPRRGNFFAGRNVRGPVEWNQKFSTMDVFFCVSSGWTCDALRRAYPRFVAAVKPLLPFP